jgi:hypothetical protein
MPDECELPYCRLNAKRSSAAASVQASAQRDDGSAADTLADWVRMPGSENPAP